MSCIAFQKSPDISLSTGAAARENLGIFTNMRVLMTVTATTPRQNLYLMTRKNPVYR